VQFPAKNECIYDFNECIQDTIKCQLFCSAELLMPHPAVARRLIAAVISR